MNGTAVSALPKGALNKDNTISYTYTTASLAASTTLSVGFAAKKTISVSVTGSSATKDEIVAGKNLPVIKFTPEIAGTSGSISCGRWFGDFHVTADSRSL